MSQQPSNKPATAVSLILAFVLASLVVALLSVLTLGFVGVVVGIGLLMTAFIAFNYVLWGRWLGAYVRRREAEEEADRQGAPPEE